MRKIKWALIAIVVLIVGGFLHYTLPRHDIVRVVNTYQERQELGDWTRIFWSKPDDLSAGLINRDVQFIQTVLPNGKPRVFRNEDTGWSWPPYFKFDTANLLTQAEDLKSTADAPKWAVVTFYGWRNEWLTVFPNAISIKPVAGPDVTVIPWFNIFFFVFLLVAFLFLRAVWLQFRERTIDPALEEVEERWDAVEDRVAERRGRLSRWLDTWRSKKR
ncbi:DUF1523 family protein [Seohaeicola zhoushanensis]|uniref:DUF1523 family protein n=1 Tax=Seohaeicola zhoushanensis TaxID=1569283 RepID=A0A8J3GVF7_9RHOB|nr:DUF1523 family protein [Seohaeicola zhoushanensis]GHF40384.1 hypothetical protein GCM10017056_09920 [Seohaeicola zhoushanensis]